MAVRPAIYLFIYIYLFSDAAKFTTAAMKPYQMIPTCAVFRQLFTGRFIPEMTLALVAVSRYLCF